jgi:hypothetical protein
MLVQCCAHYSIVAMYMIRKDYIATTLCENRDKPEMKCAGKCYLKKQLKKVNGSTGTKSRQNEKELTELPAYVLPHGINILTRKWYVLEEWNKPQENQYDYEMPDYVFRPPIDV